MSVGIQCVCFCLHDDHNECKSSNKHVNAMRRDTCCDSYIVQSFNSGTEIADVDLGLPSPCVIANHVSCCCKHACFDIPRELGQQMPHLQGDDKEAGYVPKCSFYHVTVRAAFRKARFPLRCRQVSVKKRFNKAWDISIKCFCFLRRSVKICV